MKVHWPLKPKTWDFNSLSDRINTFWCCKDSDLLISFWKDSPPDHGEVVWIWQLKSTYSFCSFRHTLDALKIPPRITKNTPEIIISGHESWIGYIIISPIECWAKGRSDFLLIKPKSVSRSSSKVTSMKYIGRSSSKKCVCGDVEDVFFVIFYNSIYKRCLLLPQYLFLN